MTYTVRGFIIGKEDIREYDRLFYLYTEEQGRMVALAQGVRKISSKLCGNLEPLSHVTCGIARGKSLDRIASVTMHNRFLPVKEQLEKCSAAQFFFEVLNQLVKDGQSDEALCHLIGDVLVTLEEAKSGQASAIGIAALAKLSMILGLQSTAPKSLQLLHRTQSLTRFNKVASKADHKDLFRRVQVFIQNNCDRPLRSKEFFDFYSLISTKSL